MLHLLHGVKNGIQQAVEKLKNQYENIYILSSAPKTESMSNDFEYIYGTEGKIIDDFYVRTEIYSIYKVNK